MCPSAQLQVLQQEFHTQKQVRAIQPVSVLSHSLTVLVCAPHGAHVIPLTAICYFGVCASAARNSCYSSEFEQRGETGVMNIVSPGSGSNGNTEPCPSGLRQAIGVNDPVTICLLAASLMSLQLSVNLVSLQNQDLTPLLILIYCGKLDL